MTKLAKVGAVIFAKDAFALAEFYRRLLDMRPGHQDPAHTILESADTQLVVHAIPPAIAATIKIASPPKPRSDAAIKLFFTVPSLSASRAKVTAHGGALLGESWQGDGYVASEIVDPEGNVLQLRESVAADSTAD